LYIFDDLFRDRALSTYRVGREGDAMTLRSLWEKRPEWGGMILELMKKNQAVHLCVGGDNWYRVVFYTYAEGDFFKFISERSPVMNAPRNCLISKFLLHEMEDAISDLMEPMWFGQSMMYRLSRRRQGASNEKPKAEFTGGDHRDLCYELETLINDVMHQRDLWKDRFFFQAIDADEDELCEECNDGMRSLEMATWTRKERGMWKQGM